MSATTEMTFSEFLRHSGDAVDRVEHGDVRLNRRDGEDLYLKSAGREEAEHESLEAAGALLAGVLEAVPAADVLPSILTRALPWTYQLPDDDRRRFVEEFLATIASSASLDAYAPVGTLLRQWKTTALAWADPAVMAGLREVEAGDVVERPISS